MQEYRPIAAWLKTTRERQLDEKGDPWTQDHLLALMHAEVGWAPYRPNYSKYESGKATPKRETLAKFVRFWEQRGEPGPDMTPPAEPVDPMVAAVDRQTDAIREQTTMLKKVLDALTERTLDPALVRGLEQWGLTQAAIRSQLADDPAPGQSAPAQ